MATIAEQKTKSSSASMLCVIYVGYVWVMCGLCGWVVGGLCVGYMCVMWVINICGTYQIQKKKHFVKLVMVVILL